ncbi:hypothetical protein C343_00717 [Cryptococcus neoformans C23]|uniref:Uncharacterized protein n=1 Tax=Cryptococcus neoformans (strain H99 / ATCC 208821 / CBS 10515 / FGSC 9487) TaxID=235443 RepID=J9VHH1_CRYN9|nr:hypothetical protein CNAG_07380 [Cryptococcus neoformans var. grubii H99]AUB22308.1 hypothetical protein CKF44_07380 [Cryptococcus neoformans var. grubii]OWZ36618.1 hypothetical protein C347_00793 [Cryptococcus neoformans var. grubii AD2-60a]OWZ48288.1 hypothetical protein C343_00717 [Cryptococcus neoformans var. grubii C23]OXC86917.1 hypothetical protein C344_00724 [Cryptococcus neoformans var. grubii AD1-7a]AFR92831.1 hypothetical protein CNAG_07380 [Cryptococcus neoformans var. grubii H9|eukprot:XP_012047063.1 hypothetical protein CNAG_07380 [Cryptococcus neoformans var. grubii H99]
MRRIQYNVLGAGWRNYETAKDYPMHRRSVRSTTHPTNLPFWSTEPDGLGSDNIASPKVNGRSSERRLTSSGNKYKTWDEIDLEQRRVAIRKAEAKSTKY